MIDKTLVVLNQGGGSNESVGIRIEREVNGVMMGVLVDEGENGTKENTFPCNEIM